MSIAVLSWAFAHSEAKLGDRLVLFALADHAKDDGTFAWPSVATIARAARLSPRQVQRCLRNLETLGEIELTGRSKSGTNIYSIAAFIRSKRGDNTSPLEATGGDIHDTGGVTSATSGGDVGVTRSVLRATVSTSTVLTADRVLALWNELAGQALRSKTWLRMINARLGEYPELELEDHRRMMENLLDQSWWRQKGGTRHATPNLIYGNGAQFERSLLHSTVGQKRGSDRAELDARIADILRRGRPA